MGGHHRQTRGAREARLGRKKGTSVQGSVWVLMNCYLQVTDLVPWNRALGPWVHLPESTSPATEVIFLFPVSLASIDVDVNKTNFIFVSRILSFML